ncbi:hypothetical protein H6G18_01680 [Anabaena subtropica FACHB-260]|uniref:Uncharacterized protein n=1 Tax=Anabaena subtropica FACHB-260 TaxID=2692884 RepID=A0ABR8CK77_9NOST|nr:hypothetical protein [Anabaena subtropica FACHB-260]
MEIKHYYTDRNLAVEIELIESKNVAASSTNSAKIFTSIKPVLEIIPQLVIKHHKGKM